MLRVFLIVIHRITRILFSVTFVPGLLTILWQIGWISFRTFTDGLLTCAFVFVVMPLIFKYSIFIQRNLLFLSFVKHINRCHIKRPDLAGLYAARNFNLEHTDEEQQKRVSLGCWHILPNQIAEIFADEFKIDKAKTNLSSENIIDIPADISSIVTPIKDDGENRDAFFEQLLSATKHPIILYLHGNAYDRSVAHRVELYNVLRSINVHVVTFDYRSYGDSSPVTPSELGLVNDALLVYKYLTKLTTNPIFIWGHSLGTGVGCHLAAIIQDSDLPKPKGVILESPFSSIADELKYHPLSTPFRQLPWFNFMFIESMHKNNFRFESDVHVGTFRQPLLVLHAEDDLIVPFPLGLKLYKKAIEIRQKSWGPVAFHRFAFSLGFGHKYICQADNLPQIVIDFIIDFKNTNF